MNDDILVTQPNGHHLAELNIGMAASRWLVFAWLSRHAVTYALSHDRLTENW